MLSPLETGTTLGATPGPWEEPGNRSLARVSGTGGRRAASAKPGSWRAGRGEAGQGPSISYMEGPCLILPGETPVMPAVGPDARVLVAGFSSRSAGMEGAR
jgi:hypothetical protein